MTDSQILGVLHAFLLSLGVVTLARIVAVLERIAVALERINPVIKPSEE